MHPSDDERLTFTFAGVRGVAVTTWESVRSHPDYPGWDAEATEEQIAEGLREEIGENEEKSAELRKLGRPDIAEHIERHVEGERRQLRKIEARLALERTDRNRGHGAAAPISLPRRTHGTRRHPGVARCARRNSSRAGPDDDSGEPEPPRRWQPADHLLRDVDDYLRRLGPHGAERTWLVDQIAYLGYPAERVSVALSLAVANGSACRARGQNDSDVIWAARVAT